MTEFVIDKNKYRIRYQHVIADRKVNNPALVEQFKRDMKKRKAVTVATVERSLGKACGNNGSVSECGCPEGWAEVAKGVAFCGKKDNFSKATGREVALQKLLQGMLERKALYLAGRIMLALAPDTEIARDMGAIQIGLVLNRASAKVLIHASTEGQARLNVGKLDFD